MTSRYYGRSIDLLEQYAWYQANSQDHAWPCGSLLPNDLGLFDMLGNVYEWCQDEHRTIPARQGKGDYNDIINISELLNDKPLVSFGAGRSAIHPAVVRSADRDRNAPSYRDTSTVFAPPGLTPELLYPFTASAF